MRSRLIAASIALALPAMALAAAGPLQVTTGVKVEKRIAAADGTTRVQLADARKVVPGDRVTLTVSYRNASAQPLGNVVLANPVPHNMVFRGALAEGPQPEMTVDGTRFGPLASLTARTATGTGRPARLDDVTAVRWRLGEPVPAHGAGTLGFHAQVK
jgi:uncharacterized repeat protein (TIGR01451 family)